MADNKLIPSSFWDEEEKKRQREKDLMDAESSSQVVNPLEANVQKAQETPVEAEPEPTVEKVESAATEAVSAPTKDKYIDRVFDDKSYRKGMEDLSAELAKGEEALSKELKSERKSAQIGKLIKLSIQAAAQLYAAEKGIKTALSGPLDLGESERLQAMKEDIENDRRVLRSRINSARGLLADTQGMREKKFRLEDADERRAEDREFRSEEKAIRERDKKAAAEERERARSEEKSRLDANERGRYEASINKRVDSLRTKLASKKRSEQEEFLTALGISEEVIDRSLGKEGWVWDDDPDLDVLNETLRNVASRQVAAPNARVGESPQTPVASSSNIPEEDRARMTQFLIDAADSTDPEVIAKAKKIKQILGK